jgi:hypothetical protein
MLFNRDKIILDLCGGTGAWSRPYADAGYDVRLVTLPQDVRLYIPPDNVYGILAAPPCTMFAISGNRWKRTDAQMMEALSVVDACMRIIWYCSPHFWALENPVGKLTRYLGKCRYTFQPFEYGDPWTKRTCIWGCHNIPTKKPVKPVGLWIGGTPSGKLGIVDHPKYLPSDWIHKFPQSKDRAILRSITPPGFTRAFFEANL